MVGFPEIAAGVKSLQVAKNILQGFNAASKEAAVNAAKIELQGLILDAQQGLFAAQQQEVAFAARIGELEQEIMRLKDWSAEQGQYELKQIDVGAFAYMEKDGVNSGKPAHWLCPECFENGHKSILQQHGVEISSRGGKNNVFKCNRCSTAVSLFNRRRPERPYVGEES